MDITPEIKVQIENLATIIDYGMYCVTTLSCIKHYPEECDEKDRFWGQDVLDQRIFALGCQAYFIIYKDILNYTEKQLEELSDNEFNYDCLMIKIIRFAHQVISNSPVPKPSKPQSMKTRTPQTSFLTFFSLLLLALGLAGQTAKATQAMQEAFDYTTSVVVGNSVLVSGTSRTWALTSGTDNTLVSGDLTYHGLNTPTVANSKMVSVANSVAGRDNLTLISTGASTTEYFSFLLKVTGTEPSTSGQAIMNVAASSSSAAGGGGAFTVFIKGTDATHYQVGIQAGSGTGTFETAAHVCGASADTVLVVVKYVNGSISLWVNPSSSTFGGGSDPNGA